MRGGVPLRGYIIDPADFRAFVRDRNVEVMAKRVLPRGTARQRRTR